MIRTQPYRHVSPETLRAIVAMRRPVITKRRDAKPTHCARCGTDDYEPSYRTEFCVTCRKLNKAERRIERRLGRQEDAEVVDAVRRDLAVDTAADVNREQLRVLLDDLPNPARTEVVAEILAHRFS